MVLATKLEHNLPHHLLEVYSETTRGKYQTEQKVFGKKIHGKNHPGKNHPSKNHPVITLYNSLSVVCLSQADTICEGKWS